jgi:hypothetical protein
MRPDPLGNAGAIFFLLPKFCEGVGLRLGETMARHKRLLATSGGFCLLFSKRKCHSQDQVCDGFKLMDGCNHGQGQTSKMKL